ncbi:tetratricopeptide repeat protein [Rubripirellula lacrimiformis]|uniref:tetratricopeptide repeat protein n=1 Tax=Rubripirellula lacrimiformis TaxID=1930273 RepID=UPI001C54DAA0|nr:tetratricopeptide repeat protein [Rubripirellula lacrimiformis]
MLIATCSNHSGLSAAPPENVGLGDQTQPVATAQPHDIVRLIAAGELSSAAEMARQLDGSSDPTVDLTMVFARLGRAYQKQGDLKLATEFYGRSVFASRQPAAAAMDPEKKIFVQLAAASSMVQSQELPKAFEVLQPILGGSSGASAAQVHTAVDISIQIGNRALAANDAPMATRAYTLAASHADEGQRPTVLLGAAWATAVSQVSPIQAAKQLADFVSEYPQHADAPRASRACAECLRQAERPQDSAAMIADLLRRWPESPSALEVVQGYTHVAAAQVPSSVRDWLLQRSQAGQVSQWDEKMTSMAMIFAGEADQQPAWSHLARHLAAMDGSGKTIADLLAALDQDGSRDRAERLATSLISPEPDQVVSPGARESACRWAGRTERWSMLAMAAESEIDRMESPAPSRSVNVERLFAESLMQLGRVDEARRWWDHLVDVRKLTDFATLLRCAEAETSVGDDTNLAGQRISLARTAAGQNSFESMLVNLLAAELAIRRSRFDEARSLLESVVRATDTGVGLRGRAQWLIGETHYLQAQFTEAIEAYRQVEGMDPSGVWVSAALVQAGKSFEQLGRTREAAVCYGSLIGRFAETPHAQIARQRMAAIDPNLPSSNNSIRR